MQILIYIYNKDSSFVLCLNGIGNFVVVDVSDCVCVCVCKFVCFVCNQCVVESAKTTQPAMFDKRFLLIVHF